MGLQASIKLICSKVESRAAILFLIIAVVTATIWAISIIVWPSGLSVLALSYTLGLRHALDADHIAAIDNVTRKLLQEGQQPITVGLMFSLGHSSVVILAAMLVALCSASIRSRYDDYHRISGFIGATISATFLTIIAFANALAAHSVIKQLRRVRRRGSGNVEGPTEWNEILNSGGAVVRVVGKRVFNVVDKPYKMYFVGFLFGLGFDTATEITLLAISSLQGSAGTRPAYILFLPLLFTAGMALLDYLDGVLMLGVYGWALVSPMQKLYYNLVMTVVSCVCALFIATFEYLGIVMVATGAKGPFWDVVGAIGDGFEYMGVGLVVAFAVGWGIAAGIFYVYGYDLGVATTSSLLLTLPIVSEQRPPITYSSVESTES